MNVLYIYICTTTFGTCDAPPPKAAPKPAAGGESTRNPSDLPAGHAVSTGTGGLSSLVMISVATLLLWWLFVIELMFVLIWTQNYLIFPHEMNFISVT